MDDEEYQREYDKALAEMDAAEKSTTARGSDGKFVKAEEKPAEEKPAEPAPEKSEPETKEEPKQEEPKPDDKPKEDDEATALRKRLESAEKALKDTQAWATKLSQERAAEKREAERRAREAAKPPILDANPELADAIRYVSSDKPEAKPDPQAEWVSAVERAHPGVFSAELDPGLEKVLHTRLTALSAEERADPLIAIREITEGKLEFATKQAEQRQAAAAAAAAKEKAKAAMSVPGAGASGSRTTADPEREAVDRVHNMTDADFEREYRKARGF